MSNFGNDLPLDRTTSFKATRRLQEVRWMFSYILVSPTKEGNFYRRRVCPGRGNRRKKDAG